MQLFINFKLKVKEAEELGLDTTSDFKSELEGYRKQLAQPYLTDNEVNDKLLKEAYDRSKTDVRASHILIKLDPSALPKDTLKAYNTIIALRNKILKGEDFAKAAKESSQDPSAKDNGGDLGYFTSMQMVYPFETVAYNTNVGEISMPVRTRFGYHIIKVYDKRPASGQILVEHIMIKQAHGATAEDSINAKKKVDEIYLKVKAGENFEDLARQPYVPPRPDTHHRNETLLHVSDPQIALLLGRPAGAWTLNTSLGASVPLGGTEPNPFALGRLGLPHQHFSSAPAHGIRW